MVYKGSCHCGGVTFEVKASGRLTIEDCNCSVCMKTGFLHLIVPKSRFTLLTGEALLSLYQFNSRIAKHYFCKECGIKPFYIPRSNPDGVDVNIRCLDPFPDNIDVVPFDGQNWEQNAHQLAHKSQE
ncbi:MAG: GFA family protein [Cellvibrionaceae bacterium]